MKRRNILSAAMAAVLLGSLISGCSQGGSQIQTESDAVKAESGAAAESKTLPEEETSETGSEDVSGPTSEETGGTGNACTETSDIVSVNGSVLVESAAVLTDEDGLEYIELGNSLKVYPGPDGIPGTPDDLVKGIGSYYINDTDGVEKEALEWRLLDIEDGAAVLVTNYSVDPVPFNIDVTAGNDWESSNLRSWLNSRGGATEYGDTAGFYDTAFTDEEKKLIVETTVRMDYSGEPLWDTSQHPESFYGSEGTYSVYNKARSYADDFDTSDMTEEEVFQAGLLYASDLLTTVGTGTTDYVYAISGEEFFAYFGDPDTSNLEGRPEWVIASYRDALFKGTAYAEAHGLKVHDGSNPDQAAFAGMTDTWTRSPAFVDDEGCCSGVSISSNGNLNAGKAVNSPGYGALPVIRVALESISDAGSVSGGLMAGAAKRDITPTSENGLLPIEYVGTSMGSMITDVLTDMNVRVIAVKNGSDMALIICTESGKGPYGPQFVPLYAEHAGIPVENVFVTTTHCHSVPEIKEPIDMELSVDDESFPALERWAKLCYLQTIDAIDEAVANLEPARMGVGYTDSYINVNRNRTYYREDGTTYVGQGYNPEGYSDKTLAVVEFTGMDGNPIAFITNYAMHAVTMYAPFEKEASLHSDVPGFVSAQLEKKYEDCVAMWTSGFAGDQNPIIAHGNIMPNLETGEDEIQIIHSPSGDMVEYLGGIQYADTLRAINSITEWTDDADIACGYDGTVIPSETAEDGEFGVELQLVRIGELALIGHGGELYNSFTSDLIDNTDIKYLIAFDNVWSHEEQEISYHPDDDAILNGSYHDTTQYEPGYLSDAIIEVANRLLEESYN